MGVFTDQVQNVATSQRELISEAKRKRLEREEAKRQKERLQLLEMQLYNALNGYFDNEIIKDRNYKEQYIKLTYISNKMEIINELTQNEQQEFYLSKKYNSILNNVYTSYKTLYNNKIKNNSELKLYRTLKNTLERKELHTRSGSHYFKTTEEAYNFLIMPVSKDLIINIISNDIETSYKLDKKYFNILNTLYKPYKLANKQLKTNEQYKTLNNKIKSIRTENKKNHNAFILIISTIFAILIEAIKIFCYIFIVPLVFIISFFIHKK